MCVVGSNYNKHTNNIVNVSFCLNMPNLHAPTFPVLPSNQALNLTYFAHRLKCQTERFLFYFFACWGLFEVDASVITAIDQWKLFIPKRIRDQMKVKNF